MSNAQGNYAVSIENDMKAYDKLPMLVRMAIANSPENWAAPPLLTMHRRGSPAHVIIGEIHRWNAVFYAVERQEAQGMNERSRKIALELMRETHAFHVKNTETHRENLQRHLLRIEDARENLAQLEASTSKYNDQIAIWQKKAEELATVITDFEAEK